jgi:mannose-1-phosphate guanylyltransferase/mannose-6-phosphate isomerase
MLSRPDSFYVSKPWGNFTQYVINTKCTVKILTCNPGHKLSLQRHHKRNEFWVAIDHGAVVELDGQKFTIDQGVEVWLPAGSIHRLSCSESRTEPVRVLEISLGDFDEDDIERLEDIYGRKD